MNITQAKAALKKLYGNKAYWRYNERAPKADERAAIRKAPKPYRRYLGEIYAIDMGVQS